MAQTVINVKCIDQTLILMEAPTIAAGGVDEDKIIFSFCPLWGSFVKTAVFWLDKGSPYEAIVDDNDSCIIPSEVLEKHGNLFFGVYGINPDGIKRTSEVIKYKIVKGAVTGAAHIDPTPDVYEQLLEKIAEIEKGGGGTVTDEQIATAVENYLVENPVVGTPGADGKSAYEIAQEGGYEGTEEEFAAMLANGLPQTTSEDNGKIIQVVDGAYQLVEPEASATTTYTGEVEVV